MGYKDSKTVKYLSDPEKCADLLNGIFYKGEQIISADMLTEKDTIGIVMPYLKGQKSVAIKRYRDLLKQCIMVEGKQKRYLIIGIENQSDIHYAMPVRNLLYNAITYAEQVECIAKSNRQACGIAKRINSESDGDANEITVTYRNEDEFLSGFRKEDKIMPVITITLYWGDKSWDGPKTLKEMLIPYDENLDKYIDDSNINLFSIIDEESFEQFHTQLGKVFKILNSRKDGQKMKEIVEQDEEYQKMDKESAEIISEFTSIKMPRKNRKQEGYNVCKAVMEIRQEGISVGISVGIRQGISQGISQGIKALTNTLKPIFKTPEKVLENIISQEGFEDTTIEDVKKYW